MANSTVAYFLDSMRAYDFVNETCDTIEFNQTAYISEYEKIVNGKQGYILWGIVFVLVAFLGSIGNIITIIVLKRDPIMSTLSILLVALAISDMLAPTANALLAFSHYHLSSKYENSVYFLIFTDILRHIIQPLSTMFTMSSSWIVTTTTLFRLIAVMWPFKARTLINKKCAMIAIIIIFSFSLASCIPFYSSLVTRIKCTKDNSVKYRAFEFRMTSELMRNAYMPMMQIMCFYLPWLLALTLWLCLLRSLRQSERNFNISFVNREGSLANGISLASGQALSPNSLYCSDKPSSIGNGLSVLQSQQMLSKGRAGGSKKANNGSFVGPGDGTSGLLSKPSESSSKFSFSSNHANPNQHIVQALDSRMNNAQTRLKSYNKVTLMVVVLCFTNLICQLFTFVFIFESIFNEALMRKAKEDFNRRLGEYNAKYSTNGTDAAADVDSDAEQLNRQNNADYPAFEFVDVKMRFPKFLAYSLLLNNIFLCINHSCNIFIYTFTNPRFRRNLINLFKRNSLNRLLSRLVNSHSNMSARNNTVNNKSTHINADLASSAKKSGSRTLQQQTSTPLIANGGDAGSLRGAMNRRFTTADKCLNCFRCLKTRFSSKSSAHRSSDFTLRENNAASGVLRKSPSASSVQLPVSPRLASEGMQHSRSFQPMSSSSSSTVFKSKSKNKEPSLKPCRL